MMKHNFILFIFIFQKMIVNYLNNIYIFSIPDNKIKNTTSMKLQSNGNA